MRLRAVELNVTDVPQAVEFLERIWGLAAAGTAGRTRYLRGTGDHPYVLSLCPASAPSVAAVTFAGTEAEIRSLATRAPHCAIQSFNAPGGGAGLEIEGPERQTYRFVSETRTEAEAEPANRNRPIELSHAVLNVIDPAASERFAVEVLGFQVSDRTKMMRFLRCNQKHHALAYAQADTSSLHHIAFDMRDLDAVMHGIGRLREAGYGCVWGPGRHGPGNNVFGYFIAPFGGVVEYTAEVSEVGEDYRVGGPQDWTWPPGRMDHWGISQRDTARLHAAERALTWN